jgi:hypothetical protein
MNPTYRGKPPQHAAGRSWRQTIAGGCVAALFVLVFFGVAAVGAVAFFLGVDAFAGWLLGLIKPLMGPPVFALIGAALILFAGWALFRMATGHAPLAPLGAT